MEQNPSLDTDSCSASQHIPCVFWNRRLITVTTAHAFLFNFFKIHINIIFPSMSSSSQLYSPQVSPPTTCTHISVSPHIKFSVISSPKLAVPITNSLNTQRCLVSCYFVPLRSRQP